LLFFTPFYPIAFVLGFVPFPFPEDCMLFFICSALLFPADIGLRLHPKSQPFLPLWSSWAWTEVEQAPPLPVHPAFLFLPFFCRLLLFCLVVQCVDVVFKKFSDIFFSCLFPGTDVFFIFLVCSLPLEPPSPPVWSSLY